MDGEGQLRSPFLRSKIICWYPFRWHFAFMKILNDRARIGPLTHHQNESGITSAKYIVFWPDDFDNIFETGWWQSTEKYIAFNIRWSFRIGERKKETITTFFSIIRLIPLQLRKIESLFSPDLFNRLWVIAFSHGISVQSTLDERKKWFCRRFLINELGYETSKTFVYRKNILSQELFAYAGWLIKNW